MPKTVGYTFASLDKCLELAQAVDELGGNSSVELCADRLGKQVSGGFRQIIQSAVKYGLVDSQSGILSTTSLFKEIKLAYNDAEKDKLLQTAFLNVPLFKMLCDRFNKQVIPVSHFNKLLIKEYDVREHMGQRVKTHFIEGAKKVGLMSPDNRISLPNLGSSDSNDNLNKPDADELKTKNKEHKSEFSSLVAQEAASYSVEILGPNICSKISVSDAEDLEIAKSLLDMIAKKLKLKTEKK